jgi:ketosteroid isomerase-like protein
LNGEERIKPAKAIMEAFAARDVERIVANVTEDVVLMPSAFITGRGEYRGHESIRTGMADMAEQLAASREQVRVTDDAYYVDAEDESKVLTLAHVTIKRITGEEYGTEIAYLWTIEDGLVAALHAWLNHEKGLAQLYAPERVE